MQRQISDKEDKFIRQLRRISPGLADWATLRVLNGWTISELKIALCEASEQTGEE